MHCRLIDTSLEVLVAKGRHPQGHRSRRYDPAAPLGWKLMLEHWQKDVIGQRSLCWNDRKNDRLNRVWFGHGIIKW